MKSFEQISRGDVSKVASGANPLSQANAVLPTRVPRTTSLDSGCAGRPQRNYGGALIMSSVNKVILVGHCGRDAEVRYMPSGQPVASVSLATTSRRKDKASGEMIDDTQWHRITFYERLAEIAGEYIKKGTPLYVEGRLKYGKYTDQAGIERNTVDIIATELQLLGKGDGQSAPKPQAPQRPQSQQAAPEMGDDDIPF